MLSHNTDVAVAPAVRSAGSDHPGCLVIADGERLEITRTPLPVAQTAPVRLICSTWTDYQRGSNVPADARQWIELDPTRQTVRIRMADLSARPLFFYLDESLCIVAPAILPIAEALLQRGRTLDWDRAGIAEALLMDYPFRQRTYFRQIQRANMAEDILLRLQTGRVERSRRWIMRFGAPDEPRRSLDDAVRLLRNLTDETPLPEDAIHPLSGGYDSRLLLCLAVAEGRRPHTLTFGEFGSADLTMARAVARSMDLSNEPYSQHPEDLWTHGMDVSVITGGMVTPAHRHIYSMLHDMQVRAPMVHGFLGESFAGQAAVRCEAEPNEEQALRCFLNHLRCLPKPVIGCSGSLWDAIDESTRSEIEADVRLALAECVSVNRPSAFTEYFHNVDRQSGMVAQVISMFEMFGPCTYPYATRQFAEFFNAAPQEDRIQRRLFFQAARKLFPRVFSLPSLDRPWGPRLPWAAQSAMKTARNCLQLATDVGSGGRIVAFSPYWTEQQDYLIGRYYRQALDDAIAATETVLDADLTSIRYTKLPKWGNSYRQLRLIGLHGLMQHPTYRALTDGKTTSVGVASVNVG